MSYWVESKTNIKQFYKHDTDKSPKFFQFTREIIFSIDLLKCLMADIMFKQTSFRSFALAYNYLYNAASSNYERIQLQPKRLADVFFTYQAHKYSCEFLAKEISSKNIKNKKFFCNSH